MKKILMICHGNICRSPMAEFVMKDAVEKRGLSAEYQIDSAATSTEEIGNDIYPPAQSKLREKGIAFEHRGARQITRQDYADYDLLIGMDEANRRNITRMMGGDPDHKVYLLLDFTADPHPISDPWYNGDFETTYQEVQAGVAGLIKMLEK
ncbi:low molecular weight protein-tyrosine-phosphatase [Ligilactobacillus ceti]|uniref:protein-tyrosine-phosphatase n=1 Tax=Ligilactobacillus ceti DSM 22408 TaxID=1122146 RepID=A0A0R2KHD0_9LACO|nr:low molecular weight protein-tyrosine-phosphatase [Ligilactobacillus ceti]KRN88784.1 protein tyrosine phosphatase [Ligilactobacillus ceti DSM 22408]